MESWSWEVVFSVAWLGSYFTNCVFVPYIKRRLEIRSWRRYKFPDCAFDFYANDPKVTSSFKTDHLATHV